MKKKNYIPMVITSIVAATLSAYGSSSASSKTTYQKSISWMTTSEIETMDPNTTVDTASAIHLKVFSALGKATRLSQG